MSIVLATGPGHAPCSSKVSLVSGCNALFGKLALQVTGAPTLGEFIDAY